ncbi:MAG: hypothetical protein Q4Q03_03830 [Bowdeniella nasicola]|nr:hypothetical protein [Bowdeniella nasicola]
MSPSAPERGSISLLTIGMALALLLVGYGIVASSAIHLQRVATQALTEDLAVRAAAAVDETTYLAAGGGMPIVSAEVAQEALAAHLVALGDDIPPDFHIVMLHTDANGVQVRAASTATPPFLPEFLWPVELKAHAAATFVATGATVERDAKGG